MAPIATAVLITITEDGEVGHWGLPPFVAEAIVAAERARRGAQPDAGASGYGEVSRDMVPAREAVSEAHSAAQRGARGRPGNPGEALEALSEAQGGAE